MEQPPVLFLRSPSTVRHALRFSRQPDGSWVASQRWWYRVVFFCGVGLVMFLIGAIDFAMSGASEKTTLPVFAATGALLLGIASWCAVKRDTLTVAADGVGVSLIRRTRFRTTKRHLAMDRVVIHRLRLERTLLKRRYAAAIFADDGSFDFVLVVDRDSDSVETYLDALPSPLARRIQPEAVLVQLSL